MWDPAVALLSPEFQVLTPDLPGHGLGRQEPFSIDRAVSQIAELIRHAAPAGAIVAGDSLGGYTAMALAAAHPELVRGLVLAGCSFEFKGVAAWTARAAAFVTAALIRLAGRKRLLAKTVHQVPKVFPNAPLDAILAGGIELGARGEAFLDLAGRDFFEPLSRYPGPILVVNGETDRPNRKGEPGFLRAFPRARLVVFEGSPHGVSLRDPLRFGELIREFARDHRPTDAPQSPRR